MGVQKRARAFNSGSMAFVESSVRCEIFKFEHLSRNMSNKLRKDMVAMH